MRNLDYWTNLKHTEGLVHKTKNNSTIYVSNQTDSTSCAQKAYDSGEFQTSSDTEGTGKWPL